MVDKFGHGHGQRGSAIVGHEVMCVPGRPCVDHHGQPREGGGEGGDGGLRGRVGGEVEARLRRVVEMRVANCQRVAIVHESVELKQIAAKATGTEKPLGRWTTQLTLAPGGSIRAGAGLARHFA